MGKIVELCGYSLFGEGCICYLVIEELQLDTKESRLNLISTRLE